MYDIGLCIKAWRKLIFGSKNISFLNILKEINIMVEVYQSYSHLMHFDEVA